MLVDGMEDRISRLVQGSGLVASQLAFRQRLQMIVTILFADSVTLSNDDKAAFQKAILSLHVNSTQSQCDCNK